MPVQLGPFELEHPFLLAPMAGITNSPFRRLMRSLGAPLVVSELVSATGIEYGGAKTLELLRFSADERPVGLQIFGEDEQHLVNGARFVERLGADFVDLNLGCPVPKVVKKGAGSAMCRNPSRLGEILAAMVRAVKIPVTIKIRTGWDSESRNALEIVRAAADAGVAWVAIHGRTRAQGYSGQADWEFISEVKARSPLPIIGNGDVNTAEQALARLRGSGVDAVMLGRGALRNPFVFDQARALWEGREIVVPAPQRYLKLLERQRVLLEGAFNERTAMIHARKFLSWYSAGFGGANEFRKTVFSTADPAALWTAGREFFERDAAARDGSFLAQPFLMGGHG